MYKQRINNGENTSLTGLENSRKKTKVKSDQ
jgi:hypothetical protein